MAQRTQLMCWLRENRNFWRWVDHTLTVLSSEAVTRDWPSLQKWTLLTVAVWARNTVDSPLLWGRHPESWREGLQAHQSSPTRRAPPQVHPGQSAQSLPNRSRAPCHPCTGSHRQVLSTKLGSAPNSSPDPDGRAPTEASASSVTFSGVGEMSHCDQARARMGTWVGTVLTPGPQTQTSTSKSVTHTLGTQMRTVLSREPEASRCPEGEKFTEVTASLWPEKR